MLASPTTPVTYTAVPTGCAERLGGDRDRDGLPDYDEQRDFAPTITGHQNPFQDNALDSTGDNGSTSPDGVPDGENDFDGDGSSNSDELAAGTNPADNLSIEVPLVPVLEVSPDLSSVTLSWDAAPLGEYQVQYSDQLNRWIDSPTGYLIAGIPGGQLSWIDDGPSQHRKPSPDRTAALLSNPLDPLG